MQQVRTFETKICENKSFNSEQTYVYNTDILNKKQKSPLHSTFSFHAILQQKNCVN